MKSGNKTNNRSFLSETLKSGAVNLVLNSLKKVAASIQDSIYRVEKNIIRFFYASVLFITGIIFLFVAIASLMQEYLKLSAGWSFLVLSLILIILSFMIKNYNKRVI